MSGQDFINDLIRAKRQEQGALMRRYGLIADEPQPLAEPDPTDAFMLRAKVAGEKGVPAEAVEALRGDTREALEAAADSIVSVVGQVEPYRVATDFAPGAREPVPLPVDGNAAMNELIRDAHARNRSA